MTGVRHFQRREQTTILRAADDNSVMTTRGEKKAGKGAEGANPIRRAIKSSPVARCLIVFLRAARRQIGRLNSGDNNPVI